MGRFFGVFVLVMGLNCGVLGAQKVVVKVDTGATGGILKHVWQYYGFDECNYATTDGAKDLMRTLSRINPELVYLRQHFLLCSGDGVPDLKWSSTNIYTEDSHGRPVYDWWLVDGITDAITKSGCVPLIEIGFMPQDLSVKREPYKREDPFQLKGLGPYYPPKDYEKWAELIRQWVQHCAKRYPNIEARWLWELWNEPNIRYWQGSFDDYCKLFDYTEQAIHEVLPKAVLGGPHTAGAPKFLKDFLEHCDSGKNYKTEETGTRLDYVGFHSKGRTEFVKKHVRMDLGQNLRTNREGFEIVAGFEKYRSTPIIIGECDPEGAAALSAKVQPANGYRNGSSYAAYEVALMKHTIDLAEDVGVNLQGVLTWAFMFDGKEYFEGFRTLSTNGIHKPVLNAFKMLGMLRGQRVPVDSSGALGIERILDKGFRDAPDIDGLATVTGEGAQVLLWNYHDDMVEADPAEVTLAVTCPKPEAKRARLAHYRIDDTHSNAYTAWLQVGGPEKPTRGRLEEIERAQHLELLEPIGYVNVVDGRVLLEFELPRYGVSLVELIWGP